MLENLSNFCLKNSPMKPLNSLLMLVSLTTITKSHTVKGVERDLQEVGAKIEGAAKKN
jgi:predicted small secreted protein